MLIELLAVHGCNAFMNVDAEYKNYKRYVSLACLMCSGCDLGVMQIRATTAPMVEEMVGDRR